jgi:two-component system chemotaxis response regulator CheB
MIKVFLIDDSVIVRQGFKKIFSEVADIEVLGEADNPVDAFSEFEKVGWPDIFILDIEMPKMDGLTFLKKITAQRPTPVIMCSTLVTNGSSAMIDAMRFGAADVVAKPKINLNKFFGEYKQELLEKVRAVAGSKVSSNVNVTSAQSVTKTGAKPSMPSAKVVIIGSSTGGVQVLEEIITHLRPDHQGIMIVQHMPAGFTASFAARLNEISPNSEVLEAKEGDVVMNGRVLIAPGDKHMEIVKEGLKYRVALKDYPRVNSHKPSVNVLMNSAAKEIKGNATGFILTGMGDDGATGLKQMRDAGAKTYAQNEQTATVYGMPKMAVLAGGTETTLSIFDITKTINDLK